MTRLAKSLHGPSHRIAVIDDDADLRASFAAMLRQDGHEVREADSPASGIELVRSWKPELILLDYYLSGGTGAEFVRQLREFEHMAQVLLVTGYATEQPGRRLLAELDIQGFHDKSDGSERLLVLIDGALKHYRVNHRLETHRAYLERILGAVPDIYRLQSPQGLLHAALVHLSNLVQGGDGLVASANNGLFVLSAADTGVSIHAGTGKYEGAQRLVELDPRVAGLVAAGIDAEEPYFDPSNVLLVPLRTRSGDRGCMLLECSGSSTDVTRPSVLYAQLVVGALENVLLFERATVDQLTGTLTRAHGMQRLRETLKLAERSERPTSILMLDIDEFKQINDRLGHAAGDLVLRQMGEALHAALRESDIVARYGGEEFLVVLPDTDAAGSLVAAERVRAAIEALRVEYERQPVAISISVGVATAPTSRLAKDVLLRRADSALYAAKAAGRNRVCAEQHVSAGDAANGSLVEDRHEAS